MTRLEHKVNKMKIILSTLVRLRTFRFLRNDTDHNDTQNCNGSALRRPCSNQLSHKQFLSKRRNISETAFRAFLFRRKDRGRRSSITFGIFRAFCRMSRSEFGCVFGLDQLRWPTGNKSVFYSSEVRSDGWLSWSGRETSTMNLESDARDSRRLVRLHYRAPDLCLVKVY